MKRYQKLQALSEVTLAESPIPCEFDGLCDGVCGRGWLEGSFNAACAIRIIGIIHPISMAQQKTKHFF